ncbi:hypothetical protein Q3C01_05500 [Bradyrhizobium sp. UFLA05-109]
MSVHIVAESRAKLCAMLSILAQKYDTTAELLGAGKPHLGALVADAIVVNIDLRIAENIVALKILSRQLWRSPKRIFVIDERRRLAIVQACALGATDVLINPVKPVQLLAKLAGGIG